MSAEQTIKWAFLFVSLLGFTVQAWALTRLWRTPHHAGLARTSVCRVACAVIYIVVGINALAVHWAVSQVAFLAFSLTQATWLINAALDVRLGTYRAKHRR